tara:strand:+ start:1804 stop:2058 length:255 start_codon:yes stop_codon:yes gene_type:complete
MPWFDRFDRFDRGTAVSTSIVGEEVCDWLTVMSGRLIGLGVTFSFDHKPPEGATYLNGDVYGKSNDECIDGSMIPSPCIGGMEY